MKIVLISCASRKLPTRAKVRELYTSDLFKKNLKYASQINPDKIFILSAKYGLLDLDDEIEPYNITLNNMKGEEIRLWAEQVLRKLEEIVNLDTDEFVFLAGEKYRRYLVPKIKNYSLPLQGLGIGKQLKWLKENTK